MSFSETNHLVQKISIVIPAFNERDGIDKVLTAVHTSLTSKQIQHEIIVVDDGSTDDTIQVVKSVEIQDLRLLQHQVRKGYGAALKTGILQARNNQICIIDADGSYPADILPELLKKLDTCSMVVGSRALSYKNIPFIRRPAKLFLQLLVRYITKASIPDLNSGLRCFRRDTLLQFINILPDGFSFTTTITVAFLSDKEKIEYVPISYSKRIGTSKIRPVDFVHFLILILRLSILFKPLRVLVPISLMFFMLGTLKLSLDIVMASYDAEPLWRTLLEKQVVSTSSLLLFITSLHFFVLALLFDVISLRIPRSLTFPYIHDSPKKSEPVN